MGKRSTINYLDKDAALHFLQSDPDRVLFGYPAGKGRVYRFRYNPQEQRVETFVGAGGEAGWRVANGSWERAAKFSEEKYRTGYLGTYKRVAQRRVRPPRQDKMGPQSIIYQGENSVGDFKKVDPKILSVARTLMDLAQKLLE